MQKEIKLKEGTVPYTLRVSARATRLRLAVYSSGTLVVTAPETMGESVIEKFIMQKAQWIIDKLEYFKKFSGVVRVSKSTRKDYVLHKETARALANSRLEYFNMSYEFQYNRVSIKNQKTMWGSCSSNKNLNFNYKIALIPERLSDYIIVHELCHLEELNHSQRFWALVALTIPNYLELRAELRKQGVSFY